MEDTLPNNDGGVMVKKEVNSKRKDEATTANLNLEQKFYHETDHKDGSLYNLGDSTPLLNDEEKGAD
ncbi:hypothetical protein [Sutcliffiella horikoshii]|uniref:hypothetical protein n=1 Tax=Sutcliffiella horikoshii TaxID=79883 RepID=UPI001CFDCAB9|nr:hypothetical protein [Sutcliffiella horikoshii]